VVGLRWTAGRSNNRAHWTFSPGAHGGTVTALDELAEALLDPSSHRGPRPVHGPEQPDEPEQPAGGGTVIEAPGLARQPEGGNDAGYRSGRAHEGDEVATVPDPAQAPRGPAKAKSKRRGHPAVPAWEDVLLGVRSQRGG
jgi:hypothetical protein